MNAKRIPKGELLRVLKAHPEREDTWLATTWLYEPADEVLGEASVRKAFAALMTGHATQKRSAARSLSSSTGAADRRSLRVASSVAARSAPSAHRTPARIVRLPASPTVSAPKGVSTPRRGASANP